MAFVILELYGWKVSYYTSDIVICDRNGLDSWPEKDLRIGS